MKLHEGLLTTRGQHNEISSGGVPPPSVTASIKYATSIGTGTYEAPQNPIPLDGASISTTIFIQLVITALTGTISYVMWETKLGSGSYVMRRGANQDSGAPYNPAPGANNGYGVEWWDNGQDGTYSLRATVVFSDASAQEIVATFDLTGNVVSVAGVPNAPVLSGLAGDAWVDLTWTTPSDNGSQLWWYEVRRDGVLIERVWPEDLHNRFFDGTALNGHAPAYVYQVLARNKNGLSAPSNSLNLTPANPGGTKASRNAGGSTNEQACQLLLNAIDGTAHGLASPPFSTPAPGGTTIWMTVDRQYGADGPVNSVQGATFQLTNFTPSGTGPLVIRGLGTVTQTLKGGNGGETNSNRPVLRNCHRLTFDKVTTHALTLVDTDAYFNSSSMIGKNLLLKGADIYWTRGTSAGKADLNQATNGNSWGTFVMQAKNEAGAYATPEPKLVLDKMNIYGIAHDVLQQQGGEVWYRCSHIWNISGKYAKIDPAVPGSYDHADPIQTLAGKAHIYLNWIHHIDSLGFEMDSDANMNWIAAGGGDPEVYFEAWCNVIDHVDLFPSPGTLFINYGMNMGTCYRAWSLQNTFLNCPRIAIQMMYGGAALGPPTGFIAANQDKRILNTALPWILSGSWDSAGTADIPDKYMGNLQSGAPAGKTMYTWTAASDGDHIKDVNGVTTLVNLSVASNPLTTAIPTVTPAWNYPGWSDASYKPTGAQVGGGVTNAQAMGGSKPTKLPEYDINLRPFSSRDVGAVSSGVVTTTAPAAPVLAGTVGNTHNLMTWNVPNSGGSAITGYRLYRNNVFLAVTTLTSYDDLGLTNGVTYTYQVTAINAIGESVKSNTITLTPAAPILLTRYAQTQAQLNTALVDLATAGGDLYLDAPSLDFNFTASGLNPTNPITVRNGPNANANTQIKGGSGSANDSTRPKLTNCHSLSFQDINRHHLNIVGGSDMTFDGGVSNGRLMICNGASGISAINGIQTGQAGSAFIIMASTLPGGSVYGAIPMDILLSDNEGFNLGSDWCMIQGCDGVTIERNFLHDLSAYLYAADSGNHVDGVQVIFGINIEMARNLFWKIENCPIILGGDYAPASLFANAPDGKTNLINVHHNVFYNNGFAESGHPTLTGAGHISIFNVHRVDFHNNTHKSTSPSAGIEFFWINDGVNHRPNPSTDVTDADVRMVNNASNRIYNTSQAGSLWNGTAGYKAVTPTKWLKNLQSQINASQYRYTSASDADHTQDVSGTTYGVALTYDSLATTWPLTAPQFRPTAATSAAHQAGATIAAAAAGSRPVTLKTVDIFGATSGNPSSVGARDSAPIGSIIPYFSSAVDTVITVPDGTYTAGEINNLVHNTTGGTYNGWLILVAQSKHGVIIDQSYPGKNLGSSVTATGDLILSGTTSRIFIAGFKFMNGIQKIIGADKIRFWHCDFSYPIAVWATEPNWPQLLTGPGPYMYHEGCRPIKLQNGSQNVEHYGCTIHDYCTGMFHEGQCHFRKIIGCEFSAQTEGVLNGVGTNLDPGNVVHPDGMAFVVGNTHDITISDCYVHGDNTSTAAQNAVGAYSSSAAGICNLRLIADWGDITNLNISNTWFKGVLGGPTFMSILGPQSGVQHKITGSLTDVWTWDHKTIPGGFDVDVSAYRDVSGTQYDGTNFNITAGAPDANFSQNWIQIALSGFHSGSAPTGTDPATAWRTAHPYNSWATYLAGAWI